MFTYIVLILAFVVVTALVAGLGLPALFAHMVFIVAIVGLAALSALGARALLKV